MLIDEVQFDLKFINDQPKILLLLTKPWYFRACEEIPQEDQCNQMYNFWKTIETESNSKVIGKVSPPYWLKKFPFVTHVMLHFLNKSINKCVGILNLIWTSDLISI